MWAELSGQPPLNLSRFKKGTPGEKSKYASPHPVGCYLAHWNLLRMLQHRPQQSHSEFYMVFEDDTSCFPDVAETTRKVTRKLPPDWDILFLSGKPFTWYEDHARYFNESWTEEQVQAEVCRGRFGLGSSPLSPEGNRNLLVESDDYWRTLYMFNTHAYVVNPRSLDRLLELLKPTKHIPIDVHLADAMESLTIRAYMTTMQLCRTNIPILSNPIPWSGYLGFRREDASIAYRWRDDLPFTNCTY